MGLPLLPAGPSPVALGYGAQVWGDVTVIVRRWDGTIYRWAGDELDAANVPCDLVYTTAMPGGFRSCTCTLFRQVLTPAPEGLFDDVWVLGPGGRIYWEGRLQSMPSSTDDGGRVNPTAVGWSAHLEDDQTLQVLGTDRDLAGWGAVPAQRRNALNGFNFAVIDGGSRWDDSTSGSAGPVLDLRRPKGQAAWTSAAGRPFVALSYNCGGQPLTGIEFHARKPVNLTGWVLQIVAFSDLALTTELGTLPIAGASIVDGQVYGWAPPAGTRALELSLHYPTAPGGNADNEYGLMLAEVAVYGGLPGGQPTTSYTGAVNGPLAYPVSAVLPELLRRGAPLLRIGTIEPTQYRVPHLVGREPTTTAALVELLNRSHWWDWAVWERREFSYNQRFGGASRTWLVSTDDGAVLSMEGDTTDVVWSGAAVSYRDFAGVEHTIGPPGSTAERTDPRLQSSDPDNPATLHGINRVGLFSLSEPVDYEGAILCGLAWLDAQSQATRRGSCTIAGSVLDEHGNEHPVDMIRGGHRLRVIDRPSDPDRRVIETSMARGSRTITLTLDNTAQTLEALLERMGASFVGVL